MTTFTACIEKKDKPTEEIEIKWDETVMPSVIRLPDGRYILCRGKYLSPGERFMYRETDIYHLAAHEIVSTKEAPCAPLCAGFKD
jgi:hypothetical protein